MSTVTWQILKSITYPINPSDHSSGSEIFLLSDWDFRELMFGWKILYITFTKFLAFFNSISPLIYLWIFVEIPNNIWFPKLENFNKIKLFPTELGST